MAPPTDGVTIGQAATFAGVTVKTVRHYHRQRLLDEPRRDGSGYRRYGSADLLRLVQVRTLAAAGVPLAEVGPLLDADAERFSAGLADVERRLDDHIAELVARRDTVRRLADGDRLLLPDRALAILDRLTDLGFSADYVAGQREALVLARALSPEFGELLERAGQVGEVDVRVEGRAARVGEVAGGGRGHPEVLAFEAVRGWRGGGRGHGEDGGEQECHEHGEQPSGSRGMELSCPGDPRFPRRPWSSGSGRAARSRSSIGLLRAR